MTNKQEVNWDKLRDGYTHFKLFQPTPEKLDHIIKWLVDGYLNLEDYERDPAIAWNILKYYVSPGKIHVLYEIDNFRGLLGVVDIIPEYRASVFLKLWGAEAWKPSLVKEADRLIRDFMDEFKLRRLSTETADRRIERMAKMVGFKTEGACKNAFLWDGKLYNKLVMSITRGK